MPFPVDETGFAEPVAKKFSFSKPVTFQFTATDPDSIKAPQTIPIDLDKLPVKPFALNDFKLLKAPVQQVPFNLDQLPDSALNLEETQAQPFRLQQFILPKPVKVKAGAPKLMPNTTTGVMQFSIEEGLPGVNITASLADQLGNTWLATEKGLCMYDGDHIFIYSFLNKNEIGGDYAISKMTLDKEGNIWIATLGDGIYMLNITSNIAKHYKSNKFFTGIIIDQAGKIWASSYKNGLFVIDPVNETIKNIRHTIEESNDNTILTIAEDQYKNIWLGYFDHAAIVNPARKQIKKITITQGLIDNWVLRFMEDSRGDMWIAVFGGGIQVISLKNKTLGTINEKNGFEGMATELAEDSQQQIWMMRRDTCYVLNKERTAIKNIMLDIKMLNQAGRGSCLIDRNGNIWLGTLGKGVVIIDTKGPMPEHLSTKEGLTDNNVWGMMEDKKGSIWLSTRQGINIYDPQKNQLKLLGKKQGLAEDRINKIMADSVGNIMINTAAGLSILNTEKNTLTSYPEGGHLSSSISKCIADTGGLFWMSSYEMGVITFDLYKRNFKKIDKTGGLLSNINWDMIKDRQGNLWIGSDSGITVMNPANNTIQYLREKDGLCDNVVFKLIQHSNGEIWAGTVKGISIINTNNFTISNLTRKEGLVPQEIYDMAEHNGTVYAGSSDGLISIKKPSQSGNKKMPWRFINYGKREGFPYNDYNQNTGMVTKNGKGWWGVTPVVTVVTQEPLEDTLLPKINITGIQIMDQPLSFNSWSLLSNQLKNTDTLWDETKKNFYLKNSLPKDSGYLVTHDIRWDSITPVSKLPIGLTLPYDQNSVNFSFSNNDIKGREKILYRYMLDGADTSWSDVTDKSTSRNYFNLTAGNYTFRVSTKGFNGLWSKVETYQFSILPPWWKTWWAYLLYVTGGATIIWAYARYKSRQLVQKNLQLEEKISQRTAELSASLENLKATQTQLIQSEKMASLGELTAGIAHEIQNPLNFVNNFSEVSNELLEEMNEELNKGNYDDAKEIANDVQQNLEKINHHGKRADAIVKGMLQHSRSSTSVKESTDINKLADEYIRLAYHGLRAKDKTFNAALKTDFDESIGKINLIPQDIGRVILNLITNAFYVVDEKKKAFSEKSSFENLTSLYEPTVYVTTKKAGDKILISVKDNGNGIPQKILDKIFQPFFTTKPTGKGTGLGLSLSYDIVKAHGGELKVETTEGEGTIFSIILKANG